VEHFSEIDWVDFVRNERIAAQRADMQKHLSQDCSICRKQFKTWTALVAFARKEPSYQPPTNVIRIAKSYLFSLSQALDQNANVRVLRHVFDSFDVAPLNGVRGSEIAPRQLMYNSHNLFIDLRIEQEPSSNSMALTGQVLDSLLADGIPDDISVSLLRKHAPILCTSTSECGEFAFSFKPMGGLGLLLDMNDLALLLLLPESRVA
jgi:hypothetical protein